MVLSSHRTAAVCVLLALLVAVHGVQPAAAAGDRKGIADAECAQLLLSPKTAAAVAALVLQHRLSKPQNYTVTAHISLYPP